MATRNFRISTRDGRATRTTQAEIVAKEQELVALWRGDRPSVPCGEDIWSLGIAVKTTAEHWFDEDCSCFLAVRRLRSLKDGVPSMVRWLAPRTKRGRCRNVQSFFQVLVPLQSVTARYAVFS